MMALSSDRRKEPQIQHVSFLRLMLWASTAMHSRATMTYRMTGKFDVRVLRRDESAMLPSGGCPLTLTSSLSAKPSEPYTFLLHMFRPPSFV
jgi:hypothetical protein